MKLFGTDGIRAKVNEFPITPNLILQLGQALGVHLKKKYSSPVVLIGKDTRISGYMLEQALSSGLCSVGVNTLLVGPLPTPGIAHLTKSLDASAGIVISASHNHHADNGIKIFSSDGMKLSETDQSEIEKLIYQNQIEFNLPSGSSIGTCTRVEDALDKYLSFLAGQTQKLLPQQEISIGLDCANGAAYKIAPRLFQNLGYNSHVINSTPNGVNINEGCGSLFPDQLQQLVKTKKLSIGIALDGDADRVILIDEKGEILDGDDILSILALDMIEKRKGKNCKVVATTMSNIGLDRALEKQGCQVIRSEVGDRFVMHKMIEHDCELGGEPSGHIIFRETSTTGDGILAALKVIGIMLSKNLPLSQLKKGYKKRPQIIQSTYVREKIPMSFLPAIESLIKNWEENLGPEGRILVRYSGTEKKVRILAEGPNKTLLKEAASSLSKEFLSAVDLYLKEKNQEKEASL